MSFSRLPSCPSTRAISPHLPISPPSIRSSRLISAAPSPLRSSSALASAFHEEGESDPYTTIFVQELLRFRSAGPCALPYRPPELTRSSHPAALRLPTLLSPKYGRIDTLLLRVLAVAMPASGAFVVAGGESKVLELWTLSRMVPTATADGSVGGGASISAISATSAPTSPSRMAASPPLSPDGSFNDGRCAISPHLPTSPHIFPHLPTSPHISMAFDGLR